MSKKVGTIDEQEFEQTQQPADTASADTPPTEFSPSAALAELERDNIITLTAKTREQLQDDALSLIAASEGRAYANGAAGYDADNGLHKIVIKLKDD